jgi:hypothetical protein
MYLLTNENTNIAGVYKITIKRIKDATGIPREEVKKILDKFSTTGKAFYVDEEITITDFNKFVLYKNTHSILNQLRATKDYREWRKSVLERDDYTCQKCNKKGGWLHAHHIKPFAKYPELRFVVSNGITLCKSCHKNEHRGHGK